MHSTDIKYLAEIFHAHAVFSLLEANRKAQGINHELPLVDFKVCFEVLG